MHLWNIIWQMLNNYLLLKGINCPNLHRVRCDYVGIHLQHFQHWIFSEFNFRCGIKIMVLLITKSYRIIALLKWLVNVWQRALLLIWMLQWYLQSTKTSIIYNLDINPRAGCDIDFVEKCYRQEWQYSNWVLLFSEPCFYPYHFKHIFLYWNIFIIIF